jgi:hypothetical protein
MDGSDLLTSASDGCRGGEKKERHITSKRRTYLRKISHGPSQIQQSVESNYRGSRVTASTSQPSPHWDALGETDIQSNLAPTVIDNCDSSTIHEIRVVYTESRHIALKPDFLMAFISSNGDLIVQSHGLHHRPEVMKPVWAAIEDAEDKIDLGRSEDRDGGSGS